VQWNSIIHACVAKTTPLNVTRKVNIQLLHNSSFNLADWSIDIKPTTGQHDSSIKIITNCIASVLILLTQPLHCVSKNILHVVAYNSVKQAIFKILSLPHTLNFNLCCFLRYISLIANFTAFPAVKEFWKLVKVWQSGTFIETLCTLANKRQRARYIKPTDWLQNMKLKKKFSTWCQHITSLLGEHEVPSCTAILNIHYWKLSL